MYLITMRPQQIQDAVRRNLPALFCAGSVEYHGPHLPVGTDFLIAESLLTEIEKKVNAWWLPLFRSVPQWAGPEGLKKGMWILTRMLFMSMPKLN